MAAAFTRLPLADAVSGSEANAKRLDPRHIPQVSLMNGADKRRSFARNREDTSNDFPHDMLLLIFSLKIGAAIRCQGISGRS
jgi:hypothetical protein